MNERWFYDHHKVWMPDLYYLYQKTMQWINESWYHDCTTMFECQIYNTCSKKQCSGWMSLDTMTAPQSFNVKFIIPVPKKQCSGWMSVDTVTAPQSLKVRFIIPVPNNNAEDEWELMPWLNDKVCNARFIIPVPKKNGVDEWELIPWLHHKVWKSDL